MDTISYIIKIIFQIIQLTVRLLQQVINEITQERINKIVYLAVAEKPGFIILGALGNKKKDVF